MFYAKHFLDKEEIMRLHKYILYLLALPILFTFSCKKDDVITSDPGKTISFSTDTLTFDTVFTTLGSVTKRFKIYNRNSEALSISTIRLQKGGSSQFRMNVNGDPGRELSNIKINGNDSLWVFIEVTVDPNNQNNPFVIHENLEFVTNGNKQNVILEAWGQNAYYYRPDKYIKGFPPLSYISKYFPSTTTINLPNDKPHVIFGYLVIDSNITVNIKEDTKIHLYDNAGIWAYRGSNLKVNGQKDKEVIFQGIRLENYYDDLPGQWDRIILNESPQDHEFNYAIIKNSFIGISPEAFYLDGKPKLPTNKLILNNTIIKTAKLYGILARSYNIEARNSLIANTGKSTISLQGAGKQDFRHCTFANYWPFGSRTNALFYGTNHYKLAQNLTILGDQDIYFGNCILYGPNKEELKIDTNGLAAFKLKFDRCIVKTEIDNKNTIFNSNVIFNPQLQNSFLNPVFKNTGEKDFSLHNQSFARDSGDVSITGTITTDIEGTIRDSKPDIGAYEYK